MDVSEVRAGMRGHGLTVFAGTEPQRFDVEVIDVLENFRPDQALILIRTPHPLLDHAGSVAGMSGSPVYLDGRMIGAYAYGWNFGKDPIAGVTPIANMLREMNRPQGLKKIPIASPLNVSEKPARRAAPRDAFLGREPRDAFFALSSHVERHPRPTQGLVPAATPLMVGGMPPAVVAMLEEKLAPLGLEVVQAGGASGAGRAADPGKYVDGGSIAVQLLRGDIQATSLGTVTYVEGKRAVAFGHPMLGAGEITLPAATSRVLHVLASERSSFKIGEAISPRGALIHDRQAAIVIDADTPAPTIPVRIRLRGIEGMPRTLWNVEVVSHRLLTPALTLSAVSSALGASLNDHTDMMFSATTAVHLRGHGVQRVVDEGFSPTGVAQLGALASLRLFSLLEAAYGNPFEEAVVERIEIEIDARLGRDVVELLGARLATQEVDPGDKARIVLTLQRYAGEVEQRIVEVDIPEALAGQSIDLELLAGDSARMEQPVPRNLDDLLGIVKSGYPSTSLVVSVLQKSRGLSLGSHVVKSLPSSAFDTLLGETDSGRGEAFVNQSRIAIPMGAIVRGQGKLSVSVRTEKR